MLLPVPKGMSDVDAACLYVGHSTAWNGVVDRGRLQPGETLVVTGAAGGVGLAAVQLGRAMGAQVIAVVFPRTKERRKACVQQFETELAARGEVPCAEAKRVRA